MRSLTLEDLVTYLNNNGLISDMDEFEFADDNSAFKYIGYSFNGTHYHRFLVGMHDDDNGFYASIAYVFLGGCGNLCADWMGCPEFEGTEEEVLAYIEKRCN